MIGVAVLGATGSIGVNSLDVLSRHPARYRVVALTANQDVDALFQQCIAHGPQYAVMADPDAADQLDARLRHARLEIEVLAGVEGLQKVAGLSQVDYVIAAIVGAAGLLPTLAAVKAGKRVLLANKEALVMSGELLMNAVSQYSAELLPVDSEHNAIFQCMPANFSKGLAEIGVRRIFLTASGGPFRTLALEELRSVSPAQACAHPNWDMGRKISVDSATMMNKGLEVIEACWLFHTTPDHIQVVIHPQSVIHSMVEYVDGSVLAQLGNPDMRTPIANALSWPARLESGVSSLDIFAVRRLDFEPPDLRRFPCLSMAVDAIERGGTYPAILNAANEIAVQAFLDGGLAFTDIPMVIETCLSKVSSHPADSLAAILADDEAARSAARDVAYGLKQKVSR